MLTYAIMFTLLVLAHVQFMIMLIELEEVLSQELEYLFAYQD